MNSDLVQNGHRRSVQFGVFELRTATGELLKHGLKVKLQGKPCQILLVLLEHRGDVVTRDELLSRVWGGCDVDFESSLNTAANRLRLTLGDSAENPRYIETLPRVGYRFIAPVREGIAEIPVPFLAPGPPAEPLPLPAIPAPSTGKRPWFRFAAAALALCGIGAAIAAWWLRRPVAPVPQLHQITFRRGTVLGARFLPDSESVLYTARWNGAPAELFTTNLVSPESRKIGFPRAVLAAVSSNGELALLSNDPIGPTSGATLLRVRENAGVPLAVSQEVIAADWLPDGVKLALIRVDDRGWLVEFPRGKVVYRSSGWMSAIRVSPDGGHVAVLEHPVFGDDGGSLRMIARDGGARVLGGVWASVWGMAWAPSGKEVWFTAAGAGTNRSLHAVSLTGKLRDVAATPGMMTLEDISRSGRVLVSHGESRMMMVGSTSGDGPDRDYSWFDMTRAQSISADGRAILFDETGEGGGPGYSAYLYRTDTGGVVRVGGGRAVALSPDARYVISEGEADQSSLHVIPLEPGPSRTIAAPGMKYIWAEFLAGNKSIVLGGSLNNARPRIYTQEIDGGVLRPREPEIWLHDIVLSQDGVRMAGLSPLNNLMVAGVAGGEAKVLQLPLAVKPLRWSGDGRYLFVSSGGIPSQILRVDVEQGIFTFWRSISPTDPAGVSQIFSLLLAGDLKSITYSYERLLSKLYVVNGWN